ncbi:MAG: PEP-CTERM sorting domain-containing protein [Rubritalea sp.]
MADESGLVGPAGGGGTTWNQYSGADSTGTVVDSSNATTTVGLDTNFGLTAFDDPVIDLTMLRGSMTEFGKGVDNRTVALSGLENGGVYDIWMVSFRNQGDFNGQAEQYAGWWSTSNATTSSSDQFIDARGAVNNTSTFVDGYNYVLFENVEADGSGNILFTGTAGDNLDGSVDAHRFGLNGLQINQVPEPSTTALLGLGGLALILRRRK